MRTELVVNGQPTTVEERSAKTVFAITSYAMAQTGQFRWWTPEQWEARCVCGALLPWSRPWSRLADRRGPGHAKYCRRDRVFVNLRPGAGS